MKVSHANERFCRLDMGVAVVYTSTHLYIYTSIYLYIYTLALPAAKTWDLLSSHNCPKVKREADMEDVED